MTCTAEEFEILKRAVANDPNATAAMWARQEIARQLLAHSCTIITPDPNPDISPELQAHIRDWRLRQDRRLPV